MGIGNGGENRLPEEGKYMNLGVEIDLDLLFDTTFYKKQVVQGRLDSHLKSKRDIFIDEAFNQQSEHLEEQLKQLDEEYRFNRHFPLNRYLYYHGSMTTPPCTCIDYNRQQRM